MPVLYARLIGSTIVDHVATLIYLTRADWNADESLPRLGRKIAPENFTAIVLHHTVRRAPVPATFESVSAEMRALQVVRPDLGLDVPYSFVGFDGWLCEGRGFGRIGAHTAGLNSSRYGVALAADTRFDPITDNHVAGVRWVGRQLEQFVKAGEATGHGNHAATACPGPGGLAIMPAIQPPYDSHSGDSLDMQLITDTEAPVRQWATWIKNGTTHVREYGTVRAGAGVPEPGIGHVIDEQIRKGNIVSVPPT